MFVIHRSTWTASRCASTRTSPICLPVCPCTATHMPCTLLRSPWHGRVLCDCCSTWAGWPSARSWRSCARSSAPCRGTTGASGTATGTATAKGSGKGSRSGKGSGSAARTATARSTGECLCGCDAVACFIIGGTALRAATIVCSRHATQIACSTGVLKNLWVFTPVYDGVSWCREREREERPRHESSRHRSSRDRERSRCALCWCIRIQLVCGAASIPIICAKVCKPRS